MITKERILKLKNRTEFIQDENECQGLFDLAIKGLEAQKLLDTIAELTKDKEALRECVEFYANQDHWIGYHRDCTSILDDDVKAKASDDFDIIIGGRRARKVLEEIK